MQSKVDGEENVREGVKKWIHTYIHGEEGRGHHSKGNVRGRKVKARKEEGGKVMHLVSFIALLLVEPRERGTSI